MAISNKGLMSGAAVSAALSVALFAASSAQAQNVVSNGSFSVGIGANGELYDSGTGIGFRRLSDGYDPLAPGSPYDSWGVETSGGSAYSALSSGTNITGTTLTGLPGVSAKAVSTTSVGVTVTQTYNFLQPNVLKVTDTITNTSGGPLTGVLFQRDVDWDVAPTEFNENSFGNPIRQDRTLRIRPTTGSILSIRPCRTSSLAPAGAILPATLAAASTSRFRICRRRFGHDYVSLRHQPGRRERQRPDRRCERGRRLLLGRHPEFGERRLSALGLQLGDHRRGVVGHSGAVDLGDDGPWLRRSRLRGLSPWTQGERRHRLNKISFSIAIGGRLRAVPFFAGCQGTRRRPSCRCRKKRGAGRRPRKSNSGRFTGEELNSPIDRLVRASKLRGLRLESRLSSTGPPQN